MLTANEVARALADNAEQVARALLGDPTMTSRSELRWRRKGSLSVGIAGPRRGKFFDHEAGHGGDLLDLLAREHGLGIAEALPIARQFIGAPVPVIEQKPRNARKPTHDAARTRSALAIFEEAGPLEPSPAGTFLQRRGVDVDALPDRIHEALRWHPRCPWGDDGGRHGCMLALWTDATTGAPRAIHRTAIGADGVKIGRRSLGPNAGCVIRLWPDDAVTTGVVLGEGIETTLVAATRLIHSGTVLQPAWAAGDAGHMRDLPILSGIDALTLLVDNDESGTGQRAAAECARRWTAAGREVTRLIPRETGADMADLAKVMT